MTDSDHYDYDERVQSSDSRQDERALLPAHGVRTALLYGIGAGLLALGIWAGMVYANASLYQEAGRLGNNMSLEMAQTISGLNGIGIVINLILTFLVGFLVGRLAVRRMLGFLAGALTIAVVRIGGFLLNYVPGYPERLTTGQGAEVHPDPNALLIGYLILIGFILFYCLVGGLIGLWGANTATKNHDYYALPAEE